MCLKRRLDAPGPEQRKTLSSALKMVVRTSPVILPQVGIRRVSPRPPDLRQAGYERLFDDRTLFYDSIRNHEGITLVGPPLLNLEDTLSQATFNHGNGPMDAVNVLHLDRTTVVELKSSLPGLETLSLRSPQINISTPVMPNYSDIFSSRHVLITKSKNNDLRWISDWVKFHVDTQGIDAVLLYDNGSNAYGPEDVLEAIAIPGIETAIVVDWPFKFGPQGGNWDGMRGMPWDSDFCEYGIMEHARRKFLNQAEGVLNADIDELVITEGGSTVFETLNEIGAGAISYTGRWIESVNQSGSGDSYADYFHYDERRSPTTAKWAIAPKRISHAKQWKTHKISGVEMVKTTSTMHRHFMSINLNWKWQRTDAVLINKHHQIDEPLKFLLDHTFGPRNCS